MMMMMMTSALHSDILILEASFLIF